MSIDFDFLSNSLKSMDKYLEDSNRLEQYDTPIIDDEKKKEKKNLFCVVCGAKAIGYNFDQISCESCKAFFRRNALRHKNELRCRFSGTCKVTVESRRHCPFCRLQKCLAVGMRKDWIQTEQEKVSKRLRIEKIRRRQLPQRQITKLSNFDVSKSLILVNDRDRTRLNNITHCYNIYTREPSAKACPPITKLTYFRLDELFNRKVPIFVNLISYFKHLPECQNLDLDDQVTLIKQNIRLLVPLNYAMLRAPDGSRYATVAIQTINCYQDANVHGMLRGLADLYIFIAQYDSLVVKLFITVLFFSTTSLTTRSIYDSGQYQQLYYIREIQTSYMELLWLYLNDKYGEESAIHLLTKMVTKYLHVQSVVDQVDTIIQMNKDIENVNQLMKTLLQLT